VKLGSALADSPSTIFQTLAETILQITGCDSAGLSLLTTDGQTPDLSGKRFYWPAIAGMWNPHVGGGTPRNFGPCGDVLDQNRTLLFKHFERRYPYLLPVIPAAEECLLVPFYVAGKAVGTIWAILHSDRRQFDAEDDRVMGSLGKFASSAYQALESIDKLRFQIGEREKAEAAVHRLADGLETQVRVRTRDLERRTHELLESNKELEKEIAKRRRAEDRFRLSEARALGLANEQAALRRVAVLVAQQPSPSEVFTAVTQAVGLLLGADLAALHVFPGDGTARTIASWSGDGGPILPIELRFPLDGDSVAARIFETAAPARIDSYAEAEGEAVDLARRLRVRSTVGAPILVQGELWGALMAATRGVEPWAENAETRIAAFTELVATAIANAESREALAELADEQAALRRVATLVAQGASPQDLFEAVAEEVGRVLPAGSATMGRFEPDGSVTGVASWSTTEAAFPTGGRWPAEGTNVAWMVLQTGRSARIDDFSAATDPIGATSREAGIKSCVGSPVVVQGRLWGVMTANSTEGPMPLGTEARLASFTELVATAIANAEGSAELAASRRRIVAASDDARRRTERDLHDGVQQQLVSLGLELGAMKADPPSADALKEQLASVTEDVGTVLEALVEIARGIHPAILSQGGLAAALKALARRSAVPVELHEQIEASLPDEVEVAAYYIAAEALTNVAKHARASVVHMDATTDEGTLTLMVRDDGVGGADPGRGSGLVGLQDRVEALGGTITIDSSAAKGTCVEVTLPIATAVLQPVLAFR
jgi:signal transduction histidine kinase